MRILLVLIVVVAGFADIATPQKTLQAICYENAEYSAVSRTIFDKEAAWTDRLTVVLYDLYVQTKIECRECLPWVFAILPVTIICIISLCFWLVIRESREMLKLVKWFFFERGADKTTNFLLKMQADSYMSPEARKMIDTWKQKENDGTR